MRERCAPLGEVAIGAALDLERSFGGVEVRGLKIGVGWAMHVPLHADPSGPQLVPIGLAPLATVVWMDREGGIFQHPDGEACLPLARSWLEYVALFVEEPDIVQWPAFHGCVAAVEGLTPEKLAALLGVASGGMARGALPAVWSPSATPIYASESGRVVSPTDGATFSCRGTDDLARALVTIGASQSDELRVRLDSPQLTRGRSKPDAEVLLRFSFHAGNPRLGAGCAVVVRVATGTHDLALEVDVARAT